MEAIEAVAVIILILAIAVLVYYYLLNSPKSMDKIKNYVPTSADAHMEEVLNNNSEYNDLKNVANRLIFNEIILKKVIVSCRD